MRKLKSPSATSYGQSLSLVGFSWCDYDHDPTFWLPVVDFPAGSFTVQWASSLRKHILREGGCGHRYLTSEFFWLSGAGQQVSRLQLKRNRDWASGHEEALLTWILGPGQQNKGLTQRVIEAYVKIYYIGL